MKSTTLSMLVLAVVTIAIAFKFAPLGLQVVVYAFWATLGVIEYVWVKKFGYTVSSEYWDWFDSPWVPTWQKYLAAIGTVGFIGVFVTLHLIFEI